VIASRSDAWQTYSPEVWVLGSGQRCRLSTPANAVTVSESQALSALDWMAVAVEEHGREIVEVYLQAMRKGDWRAAEARSARV
jgi:hypothetical protein